MLTGPRFIVPLLVLCTTAARGEAPVPEPPFAASQIQESTTTPQTVVEDMSPAMFGMAVVPGVDGRLSIARIAAGSPADEAGLQAGDVIVSADGQFLTQSDRLQEFLAAHPATPIQFAIERDGAPLTIEINAPASAPDTTTSNRPDLDADARPALGVRFVAGNHVIISEILAGSPAEAAGLEAGDQLIAVNDDVIASSDHFITRIATADLDESLTITYLRSADRRTATITPAAWDVVFATSQAHTTLKPDGTYPVVAPTTVWPGSRVTNMSPVGVPLIAYPYYYPSAFAYWGYPHYGYYAGYQNFYPYFGYYPYYYGYYPYYSYSPYGYYNWPYAVRWGGPVPGRPNRPATAEELDSAEHSRGPRTDERTELTVDLQ